MNPYLSMILGAVCISFAAIFVKLADTDASVSALFRTLYGTLVLALFILIKYLKSKTPFIKSVNYKRLILLSMIPGFVFALDLFVWHKSIPIIGAGLSTVVANTQVFYSVIIGYFFFGERLSKEWKVILPLAFIGVVSVGIKELSVELDWHFLTGIGYASLAGISYVVFLMTNKRIRDEFSEISPIFTWTLISFFSSIGLFLCSFLENATYSISLESHMWLFLLGLIAQAVGWIFITFSLSKIQLIHASFILLGQPILSTLWGYIFFGETLTSLQIFGVLLVFSMISYGQYLIGKKRE